MPALALRGIVKRFGDLMAVDGVDLDLEPGAIVGLIGENGAGKSTLANIAFGAVAPDEGTVERNGVVGLVHQHFQLVERLSVWENVLLGREPRKGWRLDVSAARARVRELGERYGLHVDPDAIVETLPIGVKQRVELLRELEREPAILLLDEPTAVLAPSEIEIVLHDDRRARKARDRDPRRHAQARRSHRLYVESERDARRHDRRALRDRANELG